MAQGLVELAIRDSEVFSQVIDMTWIADGRREHTIHALGGLAIYPEIRSRVYARLNIADGINDDQAARLAIFSAIHSFSKDEAEMLYSEDFIAMLFDSEQVVVEERIITLPSREVMVTVVRASWENSFLDKIEGTIWIYDEFMSTPFPYEEVLYTILKDDPNRWLAGRFVNGGVASRNKASINPIDAEWPTAHETAHFYHEGKSWLVEGSAELMTHLAVSRELFSSDESYISACLVADNISEFERIEESNKEPPPGSGKCMYILGLGLFRDLYGSLDETAFRIGFRNLYLMRYHAPIEGCTYEGRIGVCHLRNAFTTGLQTNQAMKAVEIINNWYDGEDPQGIGSLKYVEGIVIGPQGRPINNIHITLDGDLYSFAQNADDGTFRVPLPQDSTENLKFGLLIGISEYDPGCDLVFLYGADEQLTWSNLESYWTSLRHAKQFSAGDHIIDIVIQLPTEPDQLCAFASR